MRMTVVAVALALLGAAESAYAQHPYNVTVNVTDFLVLRLKPGARKMHVPLPPGSPVVHSSDARPAPFHVPTTVAPFNG